MPKYRFTTVSGDKLDLNPSWIDFPSDEAASRDAQRALADMANDQLPDGSHFELRIAVENQAGEVVYQASLDFHGETAEEMRSNTDQTDRASMNGTHSPRKDN